MKKTTFFTILLLLSILRTGISQTLIATADCNSITATVSTTSNLWGANMMLSNCSSDQGPCCKIIRNWSGPLRDIYGPPSQLQVTNYRLYESGNYLIAGPQTSPTFSNLPHGTYKITADVPIRDNCANGSGDPIALFGYDPPSEGYVFVGNRGHLETRHTQYVVVGPTDQDDFYRVFLTNVAGVGAQPKQYFCLGDEVFLHDVSPNYNLFWVDIYENEWPYRWESTYWVNGTTHNNYTGPSLSLTDLWRSNNSDWTFSPDKHYSVQFAIENRNCINPSWNVKHLQFTFPSEACATGGSDDRSGSAATSTTTPIRMSPNPASNWLTLHNLQDYEISTLKVEIQNMLGQSVLESFSLATPQVDVSSLSTGAYILYVSQNGRRIFTEKLLVQH
jgi:hypothetical protein